MGLAPEVDAWRGLQSSVFVAAMIYPGILAGGGQVTVGNVLPILSDLLYPIASASISARFFSTATALWIFRVVAFEKQLGVALDTIEHATAEHQVNVRVAFLRMQPPRVRVLFAANLPNKLPRAFDLLCVGQLHGQSKFNLVIKRGIGSFVFVGLDPKHSRVSLRPAWHIPALAMGELTVMALGETPKPHDVIVLVHGEPILRSATTFDSEMENAHAPPELAVEVFARRRCALFLRRRNR